MFANRYVIALVVPVVLILSSALAKKLVRGSPWIRSDFFMGVELALSAIAASVTNFLDLSKEDASGRVQVNPTVLGANGAFIGICFFLLMFILTMHQEWERNPQARVGQIWWLGIFCNGIGAGLLISFILLVKGV